MFYTHNLQQVTGICIISLTNLNYSTSV